LVPATTALRLTAPTVTTPIIRIRVRLMGTTVQTGLRAACSLAPAPGTAGDGEAVGGDAVGTDVVGVPDGMDTDGARAGVAAGEAITDVVATATTDTADTAITDRPVDSAAVHLVADFTAAHPQEGSTAVVVEASTAAVDGGKSRSPVFERGKRKRLA